MKKVIITMIIAFALLPGLMYAQNPPHPNGGNSPGIGNTPVGGGAPIDGGITLLLLMGAGYGINRIKIKRKLINL